MPCLCLTVALQLVTGMTLKVDAADKDYKGTQKFTWLAEDDAEQTFPVSAKQPTPVVNATPVGTAFAGLM